MARGPLVSHECRDPLVAALSSVAYRGGPGRDGISGLPFDEAVVAGFAAAVEAIRVTTRAPSASDGLTSSVWVASAAPRRTAVAVR